jgi:hypothetical protein
MIEFKDEEEKDTVQGFAVACLIVIALVQVTMLVIKLGELAEPNWWLVLAPTWGLAVFLLFMWCGWYLVEDQKKHEPPDPDAPSFDRDKRKSPNGKCAACQEPSETLICTPCWTSSDSYYMDAVNQRRGQHIDIQA